MLRGSLTLSLVRSRAPLSPQHAADEQLTQASTENPAEMPQPDLPQAQPGGVVTGGKDQPVSLARAGASAPEAPSQNPYPTQSTARLQKQAPASSQPQALSTQDAQRQAEVWSYPPLLQQNASNNFVRAMETLANAKTEFDRYLALGRAAKSDLVFGKVEDARNYATELLSLDEKFKGESWRDGSAVYDANLVLGRIAAQEGRTDEARQYLLEAGKSTGSPVLMSFGPSMSLARDLLQSGERDAVLDFFELCRKFWTLGDERLTLWSSDVRAGRMPDFGDNLLY